MDWLYVLSIRHLHGLPGYVLAVPHRHLPSRMALQFLEGSIFDDFGRGVG